MLSLRTLGLRLRYTARVKAELNLLPALVVRNIGRRNTLHTEDLDLVAVTSRKSVLNARKAVQKLVKGILDEEMDLLVGLELVHLLDMNSKATSGIQAARAHIALEVLSLLVLHENYIHDIQLRRPSPLIQSRVPFSSSNSRSQYQHQGRRSLIYQHKTNVYRGYGAYLLILFLGHGRRVR